MNPFATPTSQPAPIALGWSDLTEHRAFLVRYAQRRLQDPALAEDLVHDVFEAVITGRASFGGRSAPRSWLVAILRHKIVDLVRERTGHDSLDTCDADDECSLPCPQPRPDEVAEQRELLSVHAGAHRHTARGPARRDAVARAARSDQRRGLPPARHHRTESVRAHASRPRGADGQLRSPRRRASRAAPGARACGHTGLPT